MKWVKKNNCVGEITSKGSLLASLCFMVLFLFSFIAVLWAEYHWIQLISQ